MTTNDPATRPMTDDEALADATARIADALVRETLEGDKAAANNEPASVVFASPAPPVLPAALSTEDGRSDVAERIQQHLATGWHQLLCGCDRWPSNCVTFPGGAGYGPVDIAPSMWTADDVVLALAEIAGVATR